MFLWAVSSLDLTGSYRNPPDLNGFTIFSFRFTQVKLSIIKEPYETLHYLLQLDPHTANKLYDPKVLFITEHAATGFSLLRVINFLDTDNPNVLNGRADFFYQ